MRSPAVLCAAGLAVTAVGVTGGWADPSAAQLRDCAPSIPVTAAGTTTLAPGVQSSAYTGKTSAGSVSFHVVRADLEAAHLQLVSTGATGTETLQDLARRAPSAVALINGDFFHVSSDDSTPTADGVMAQGGAIIKTGPGEADAFGVQGGVASLGQAALAGAALLTDDSAVPTAAAAPQPAKASTPKPAATKKKAPVKKKTKAKKKHPVAKNATKKPLKKVKKRKAKHRVTHVRVAHPAKTVHATVTPVAPPAAATAAPTQVRVSLNGINDLDGSPGAVEITHNWGTSLLSGALAPDSTEYVVESGRIVAAYPAAHAVLPSVTQTALALSHSVTALLPWLGVGDSLAWPVVPAPQVAIGGNAVLVRARAIDPGCSLAGDTTRRPRVAAGAASNGHTVVLAVSDGDSRSMPGFTTAEWASALQAVGVADALNLDGGQSATLLEDQGHGLTQLNQGSTSQERPITDGLAILPGAS